jgi:hypothetical protein
VAVSAVAVEGAVVEGAVNGLRFGDISMGVELENEFSKL